MAKTTQEKLFDSFTEAAGGETPRPLAGLAPSLTDILGSAAPSGSAGGGGGVTPASVAKTIVESGFGLVPSIGGLNILGSAAPSGSADSGGGVTPASVAKTVVESGFGLVPLIGGLIGLFGGGDSGSPPPPTKYVMPPAIDFQADAGGGAPGGVSYDQMGTPRASGSEAGAAQTTENLQTVGAQWFMDHSADIAAAVRNAMLNLSSINDVVNGL